MPHPGSNLLRGVRRAMTRLRGRAVLIAAIVACLLVPVGAFALYRIATPAPAQGGTLFVIMLENRERDAALAEMPYLASLAAANAQASQLYAIRRTSLPNRLAITAGDTLGIRDDTLRVLDTDNLFDRIERAGKSWKVYGEDMPSPCYTSDQGKYPAYHNPALYYTTIRNDPARCAAHVVPLGELAADIAHHAVPDFVWVEPNQLDNGHDTSASYADTWLAGFAPTILGSRAYRNGGKLIVTFDEGKTDAGCCDGEAAGGNIAFVAVSPGGPRGLVDDRTMAIYAVERTIGDLLGIAVPGKGATAPSLANLFAPRGPGTATTRASLLPLFLQSLDWGSE